MIWHAVSSVALLASCFATAAWPAGQTTDLLRDHAAAMQQTTGGWGIADGVLRPTDFTSVEAYSGDVGSVFFTDAAWEDFTLTCEFMLPPDVRNGAGGPSVYFRCAGPAEYNVIHFINYWNNIVLMRAAPGGYESAITHVIGPALDIDRWQRLRIHCHKDRISVSLDGKRIIEATDAPRGGIIGLVARVREVRFRNVVVTGDSRPVTREWNAFPPSGTFFTVCSESGNGDYEAFPGITRLANGDLLCVFYSGWGHVSKPGDDPSRPNGGRIAAVRSADNGKTWSDAQVVGDTFYDDRDPSVWQAKDGTVYATWPACDWPKYGGDYTGWCHAFRARSTDNGQTWSQPEEWRIGDTLDWTVWTEPRLLSDGSWLMPIYRNSSYTSAAVIRSLDDGKTWGPPVYIDESNHATDEPDIVELPGGRLLCVMRPGPGASQALQSWSEDLGKTWTPPAPIGWYGHSPSLLLTKSGILLCAHRDPGTSVHYSFDYGKTWAGMVKIDSAGGAYPGMAELPDGRVLVAYYCEGSASDIRGQFLRVSREGVVPD